MMSSLLSAPRLNGRQNPSQDQRQHSHTSLPDSVTSRSYSTDDDYECSTPNSPLTDDMDGTKPTTNGSQPANGLSLPERIPNPRRKSSPIMPAFMVSAPGKVIVFGEHAVVYGKAAVAAAISLRSYLLVTFLSKSRRTVSLKFPDINLDHTWNIDDLPWAVFAQKGKKKFYYDLVTSLDQEFLDALQPHIAAVSPKAPEHIRKIHQSSASAFLYLFLSLGSPKSAPCVYTLRSTIPISSGLGSSGSIAVCLAAALLLQIRALSGPHPDQPPQESELQIERINRWAFVAECAIHGNPSGVDNTVSSGGKAVLFKRTDYTKPPTVTSLKNFPELPLLLVNTRQSRSTAVEVAKVARLRETHPAIANLVLDAIDNVTESAHRLITNEDFKEDDPQALQRLGELITMNHGLLVSLGVSHPKLERIRAIIDHAGIGWTKLTGAGGGGCAITILKPTESGPATKTPQELKEKLEAEGFDTFSTTLAGDGVGVLWPAVLHNGSNEEGGEEIDQEKFLRAEGTEGIEKLVGVGMEAVEEAGAFREGWRFWRPHAASDI